ncbi:NeuD/PglB/VioB family sugar acetyltransferase [Candidatus Pelagibacter bacterium nBUS_49]|uniref:NeuD/PglB/VioB family sugar acetyltransferase n=1 Tax=Candidatus Pelagibacter bacterium nBUS_49 TaxID=3374196 RepID=UPI003EBF0235
MDYKKNLPQHKFDKSYIIQDYIKGQEYGMDILNDLNGKFIHCCVKKKISMRSGETDKAEVVFSKRFTNIGRKISLIFKHVGNLDLDFIVDLKNDIYFLDFNPRFGGGYPFTHLAGYNYLQYIIKFFKKEKFEVSNIKNDNFIASKGLTIFKSHKYNKKKLAIIGAGGHGKVVGEIALLNGFEVVDFFDKQSRQIIQFPYEIVGNINMLYKKLENYNSFFVAIGDNNLRYYYLKDLIKKKLNISILIHPKATISKHSKLGVGSCVMANAVINPGVKINKGVIINTSASIDHDCQIDDYSHISPNCSLSGNVKVGKFTHLGTATSVHPGINIGKNVKSGIGAKIFRNILSNNIIKN